MGARLVIEDHARPVAHRHTDEVRASGVNAARSVPARSTLPALPAPALDPDVPAAESAPTATTPAPEERGSTAVASPHSSEIGRSSGDEAKHAFTPSLETRHSVGDEATILERASSAIGSGDSSLALSILDSYCARFPRASLGSEAAVLRIEALVGVGDLEAARRCAEAFFATDPRSPYGPRVRSLVGTNL